MFGRLGSSNFPVSLTENTLFSWTGASYRIVTLQQCVRDNSQSNAISGNKVATFIFYMTHLVCLIFVSDVLSIQCNVFEAKQKDSLMSLCIYM